MLPRRCPAWRWREPDLGFCMERVNLCSDSEVERRGRDLERETPQAAEPQGAEYRCGAQGRTAP
jgi:hypothetical protein